MDLKLKEPITSGSLRATNFFNGRLVTGADMTREQAARREAARRVGRAGGDGVVYGLEVTNANKNPIVTVSKGLAVNRCGQALYLSDDATVDLLQRFGSADQPSKIFGSCQPITTGTYLGGFGFYLLVLSPVESTEGTAPTSGLNNAFAGCNTDVILETVRFNLLPIDLKNDTLPPDKKLRNYIAYRCFGYEGSNVPKFPDFFKDPLGFSFKSYGLIDELRKTSLADCDVPLAIINWTSDGVKFVDMWSVRRHVARRDDDDDWTQLVKDRRRNETEAMMMQFADQIARLKMEGTDLSKVVGTDYFRFLPPVGMLPMRFGAGGVDAFAPNTFFEDIIPGYFFIDGDRLRVLFEQALEHEPIDLNSGESVRLYAVKENFDAVVAQQNVQPTFVFARHTLPYFGQPVPKTHIFTIAPNFLPINQAQSQQHDWKVTFNKAEVPTAAAGRNGDFVKGAFVVRFPDGSRIKKMTTRFLRIGDNENPKAFFITLNRSNIEAPNSTPEVLIDFDLKFEFGPKETRTIKSAALELVDNTKYEYFIFGYWESAGGSDRFKIETFQVFCHL